MIIGNGIPAGMALAHEDELNAQPELRRVTLDELQDIQTDPIPPGYCLVWQLENAETGKDEKRRLPSRANSR